jgi:hypothetical protein
VGKNILYGSICQGLSRSRKTTATTLSYNDCGIAIIYQITVGISLIISQS